MFGSEVRGASTVRIQIQDIHIAESFNDYFVNKIDKLKQEIDQTLIVDPLEKLAKKWRQNNASLNSRQLNKLIHANLVNFAFI